MFTGSPDGKKSHEIGNLERFETLSSNAFVISGDFFSLPLLKSSPSSTWMGFLPAGIQCIYNVWKMRQKKCESFSWREIVEENGRKRKAYTSKRNLAR